MTINVTNTRRILANWTKMVNKGEPIVVKCQKTPTALIIPVAAIHNIEDPSVVEFLNWMLEQSRVED